MSLNYIKFKNKLIENNLSKPLLSKRLNYICNRILDAGVIEDIDFERISIRDLESLKSKLKILEKREKQYKSIKKSVKGFNAMLIDDDFI